MWKCISFALEGSFGYVREYNENNKSHPCNPLEKKRRRKTGKFPLLPPSLFVKERDNKAYVV